MSLPETMSGTILLIDRSERLAKQQAVFEKAGFTVLTATTTEEGLQLVRNERPDAVVAEVMLERPDAGFVFGYHMKKDPEFAKIPLILLSSIFQATGTVIDLNSPEARRWIKADAYLERPVAPDHLVAKVSGLLIHPHAVAN